MVWLTREEIEINKAAKAQAERELLAALNRIKGKYMNWLKVLGVMLGCYALPWLFQFLTVFLTGKDLSWTEAYVRAGFLLIVLIHINTRPWKE